jgi:hypothetical protein
MDPMRRGRTGSAASPSRSAGREGLPHRTRSCVDLPGFDRVAFHKEFNADVLAFFQKYLSR